MKKKLLILGILALVILLLAPLSVRVYQDGGTRVYRALTYTIVDWNRIVSADRVYSECEVYFPPYCYDNIDGLWERVSLKRDDLKMKEFLAVIRSVHSDTLVEVEPLEGSAERNSADRITFGIGELENIPVYPGCLVWVKYDGMIMESYPAQIVAKEWSLAGDWRDRAMEDPWTDVEFRAHPGEGDVQMLAGRITEIYADGFFLTVLEPVLRTVMVRGSLEPEYGLGDYVSVHLQNWSWAENHRYLKGDLQGVQHLPSEEIPNIFTADDIEEVTCAKPVIYLYPEEETKIDVQLDLQGDFLCTYPAYENGWKVTAQPDGTLTDEAGKVYNYLYWEGNASCGADLSQGFCVPGEETAEFLEKALAQLGLTRREANEFIVYWLPLMEDNAYNLISFDTEAYEQLAKLHISPTPHTLIRVFMTWKASEEWVELPGQELTAPERKGFVAVEWGGSES